MRSLTRLGVAAAATAIASAAALSGAGAAGAQDLAPVFNSPSSVSVSGRGEATEVTYTNRSDEDLYCSGVAGPGRLLADVYNFLRESDDVAVDQSTELGIRVLAAMSRGQLGSFSGVVEDGQTAVLTASEGEGTPSLTDGSFTPAVVATCYGQGDDYVEVEISAGAGVPAGLGSLDAALAGIGSSGSVAETTGSLGS